MRAILYGGVILLASWIVLYPLDGKPLIDLRWVNEAMGLSDFEALIVVMFIIVGLLLGNIAQAVIDLGRTDTRVVDKVQDLEVRLGHLSNRLIDEGPLSKKPKIQKSKK